MSYKIIKGARLPLCDAVDFDYLEQKDVFNEVCPSINREAQSKRKLSSMQGLDKFRFSGSPCLNAPELFEITSPTYPGSVTRSGKGDKRIKKAI